jgi:hypothetical protein
VASEVHSIARGPDSTYYTRHWPISKGKYDSQTTIIYYDRTDRSAVLCKDANVSQLVKLTIKTNELPDDAFEMKVGEDDKLYYQLDYAIEVTYLSGSTKYELLHSGECRDFLVQTMFCD